MKELVWLMLLSPACSPPMVESPPAGPPTTVAAVQEEGCFSKSDCSGPELCVDLRYPVCGAQPACEDMKMCGCECVTACTATSCEADEACSPDGCCTPKACSTDSECGRTDSRCVDAQCKRRGTCMAPPP
ncbi:MAG TPA: hypothetical protein VFQ51_05550 [Vicinamibacteria bacterium]|nr:hypothetical protein [Vicinamibacteria bacterium]